MPTQNQGTVFVIDDDVDIVELFAYNLQKLGYEVVTAPSGITAIWAIVDAKRPDVILLDIMMPSPDGYEICQFLKTEEAYKDIPVIIISARGTQEDIERGLALGANAYLPKPFGLEDLLTTMKAVQHN